MNSPLIDFLHRRTWSAVLLLAVLVVAGVLGARAWMGPKLPVQTVTRGPLLQTVVASGHVETPQRVDIGSQLTGTVAEVPVAQGQTVRKGQLLIALEDSEQRATVAQARAAVALAQARLSQLGQLGLPAARQAFRQAEINLQNARRQYERNRELQGKGFIGQSALDESRRSLDIAESQLQNAQLQVETNSAGGADVQLARAALEQALAGLRIAQAKLDYNRLLAPLDGTLIARNVERGDLVQPGKILMVLSPNGETQLVLQADERNLPWLHTGQEALASADAYPEGRFAARIVYINPGVDAQRGSVEVKLDVPAPPDYLRQDMTVSVDIAVARRDNVLTIAADAVHDVNTGKPWALKVEHGKAHKQPLVLGLRGTGKLEVISGLSEGDQVLLTTQAVIPGKRVRPKTQTQQESAGTSDASSAAAPADSPSSTSATPATPTTQTSPPASAASAGSAGSAR